MATVVFDIETVPEPWDAFDEYTKNQLIRSAKEAGEAGARAQLALSPLTGRIISVAVFDVERRQGAVYVVSNTVGVTSSKPDFVVKERSEKEILEDFWEGARSYDVFVTFNGRAFDVPFLLHRSIVHGVAPSRTLQQNRYLTRQTAPYHVDLMDELTMYGAMSKRPSLHMLLRAYGIESKKAQMDGQQVSGLFLAGKFQDIVQHNIDDVLATAELYQKWKAHLAPASFLNAIE